MELERIGMSLQSHCIQGACSPVNLRCIWTDLNTTPLLQRCYYNYYCCYYYNYSTAITCILYLVHGGGKDLNVIAQPLYLRRWFAGEFTLQMNGLALLYTLVPQRFRKLRLRYSCDNNNKIVKPCSRLSTVQRFVNYRANREKQLCDDAENNTAITSAGSNNIHCESKKHGTKLMVIFSLNADRFSNFLHRHTLRKSCDKTPTKNPTTH